MGNSQIISIPNKLNNQINKDTSKTSIKEGPKSLPNNENNLIMKTKKNETPSTDKILKNKTLNTTKKYGLGILQQWGCVNADCLNLPYNIENEILTFHFYSIEMVRKDKYLDGTVFTSKKDLVIQESFGILTQEDFGVIPSFKLLNPFFINEKSFGIEFIEIKYQRKRRIKKQSFNLFVTFHQKLFDDLYNRKDNTNIIDFARLFNIENNERRYLIAPIIRTKNGWDFVLNYY